MKLAIFAALLTGLVIARVDADEIHRYSVVKVEVQSAVTLNASPLVPITNRTIARVRLKPGTGAETDVWFEIDDTAGYGKVKLGLFTAAVTSARQVDISTQIDKGWVNWAVDPDYNIPVSKYCYLVGVNQ